MAKQIATVDKILSVTVYQYEEWSCSVLCTDGVVRILNNTVNSECSNLLPGEEVIKQGYQFELKTE